MEEALGGGITTIVARRHRAGRGQQGHHGHAGRLASGPHAGGARHWPLNIALLGKGNTVSLDSMWEQLRAGAAGFKLHEDWGTDPRRDRRLPDGRRRSTGAGQPALRHPQRGSASSRTPWPRSTAARIHAYHTEGAGGGHAPDIITVVSHPNVLPSSTNPTRPHTVNTLDEHLDMLMVCHHLNPSVPEDLAFAESRIRPSTIAAEDLLHDIGAISMIGSDAQAMGRIGEVVHAHLADRARDEEAPRRAGGRRSRPTTTGSAATSRSTRSARRSRTVSTTRSDPSRSASSPIWCCGSPRSSACARTR